MYNTQLVVGITAYREGKLLQRGWESIKNQTYSDWTGFLVLDGGADEETTQIFENIHDPRLKKIKLEKNTGPYVPRDIIMENVQDGIMLFLDADDYYDPDAFALIQNLFEDDSVMWISGSVRLFWENNQGIIVREEIVTGQYKTPEEFVKTYVFPGLAIFRKSVFEQLGGYDLELKSTHADFDFMLKVLERGFPSRHTERIILHKQERSRSVSRSHNHNMHIVREKIIERHPITFQNEQLRRSFLHSAYLIASRGNFYAGNREEASRLAKYGKNFGNASDYFPLQFANLIPRWLTNLVLINKSFYNGLQSRIGLRSKLKKLFAS
ncbi:glycosyltransferase family A protein [Moorena sp. SIO3B2]|uniref:glycosyltransferase family 2 protein n=1 Tax=Moorena sp. SIO3B2 TaxID=2607827 RepID=UPI0013C91560|nr:glycosyltransferase family A protein [Moorena sp. SIO3B2]NEP31280.1 glycosyltransferase family 2 protein [Moorena sp. SIO3B2]